MNIKVLGSGCKNCQNLKNNVKQVAEKNGWELNLIEVTDPSEILSYGVSHTPALIIEDELVSMGKVLAPSQVEALWVARR